jgi:hypothetical protein
MNPPANFSTLLLVCCGLALTGCASNSGLTREIREYGGDSDAKSAARHAHIDYQGATERALARDPSGLRELLRFTTSGWDDGAVGELQAVMLESQLRYWGDGPFSTVLRGESREVQKAVTGELLDLPGFSKTAYPLTYALGAKWNPGR